MTEHPTWRDFAGACVALSAAWMLISCGSGEGAGNPPAASAEGALRTAQPGDLAGYFRARIAQRSAQGLDGIATYAVSVADLATATGGAPSNTFAGTELQEAGVDEDDLLKSDGSFLYALHPSYSDGTSTVPKLRASRIQPDGSLADLATIALDAQSHATGIYLASGARRLAVIGQQYSYAWADAPPASLSIMPFYTREQLSLDLFDIAGGQPARAGRVLLDGRLIATRMIGNVLYVASAWTPDLSAYSVPPLTPAAQVQTRLANLSSAQLLPQIRLNDGPAQPLVAESECLLQAGNASLSLQLTTVTAIDLSTPGLERRSRCFAGDANALYMSPTNVYLATSREVWMASVTAQAVLPPETTTDIHKFALDGLQIDYRGSGEVAGHLGWDPEKMPYRMSEHNGDLRVLTYTGTTGWALPAPLAAGSAAPAAPPSPATLTLLREDSAQRRLAKVATLPNAQRPAKLGREGEQVYAVRFAGEQAYVVTFRRTDPLYVLDLSNPADPRAAGELTVPGYSDFLFPVGPGRLLGVGRAASDDGRVQGLQVSLFDVADAARPRLMANRTLGSTFSSSALDASRHGINILRDGDQVRVALPVALNSDVFIGTDRASAAASQGLARYTLDLAAGTVTERPMIVAPRQGSGVHHERSIQTAAATYYLSSGEVVVAHDDGGVEVPFARLEADLYGDWPARTYVARNDAEWTAIWEQHDPLQTPPPARPAVDFSASTLVGVSEGWGPNGCYALLITRVSEHSAQVQVEYAVSTPPAEGVCTQALVPLVSFARIPATGKPVVFMKAP